MKEKLQKSKKITAGILTANVKHHLNKDVHSQIKDRKRQRIEKAAEAKQKTAEARNLMMNKARDFWAVQGDASKMTNKQLIESLRPLTLKDKPAIPNQKDLLLVRFAEWSDRVTMEMMTPQMPHATPLPAEVNPPTNTFSSIQNETPPNNSVSSF